MGNAMKDDRPRFRVVHDGLGDSENPEKTWALVDDRAAGMVVKWYRTSEEAEANAELLERGIG